MRGCTTAALCLHRLCITSVGHGLPQGLAKPAATPEIQVEVAAIARQIAIWQTLAAPGCLHVGLRGYRASLRCVLGCQLAVVSFRKVSSCLLLCVQVKTPPPEKKKTPAPEKKEEAKPAEAAQGKVGQPVWMRQRLGPSLLYCTAIG